MSTQTRQRWITGLGPLALVVVVVVAFLAIDPLSGLREGFPPAEDLTFDRVTLGDDPREIVATVTNGGPDPVTVAQVLVDEAYWDFTIEPANEIPRLGSATVRIEYPWVNDEVHEVTLVTSVGGTFGHEIAVAVETPTVTGRTLTTFTLLGIFVGVIPVALGLLFFPFLRTLDRRWVNFFLALTAGLLVFLAFDAVHEAFEISEGVPSAYSGFGLIVLGVTLAIAALYALDGWMRQRRQGNLTPLYIAALIAIGIGLHNLGEGLAIGASYAIGEVGLTSFLILGFTLHNVTEGVGIVAPLAKAKPTLMQLALLGAVAGVPTIAGTWAGGLAYSPTMAVLFLSIGAGAIVQVVWEIAKLMGSEKAQESAALNGLGFLAGVVIMYATGLVVTG